jgi:hypothetical protein
VVDAESGHAGGDGRRHNVGRVVGSANSDLEDCRIDLENEGG